ncbi:hypothetical protein LA303_04705 [Candidatus Sulfidibacterium hydrothermale]|uniref:ArnT family glycosyltransferase n=1 Tax=Candidatus Sulfidibacterium hydrothermale TaxID=2875962 RepID=UPI001F0B39D8|nr:hypothetical protein [Candidatus Sulfidibacterium hydrothermale]UBM63275.1 hypothetical protein LA303_04705 [Candidatus Sulfidibacterium hydrothermale]
MRKDDHKEQTLVFILLAIFFLSAVVVVFHTQNSFGGGDHFTHFRLARWGWKYPKLLFDEWGKPVFTLLVSPFAQLGVNFARLYNVLAGMLTALLAWKLSRRLDFANSWLVVLLVLFTPIYFISMFAVLTEVTFSLFLILALYLFFDKKYILSAVVLSFLPLIRTESVVLFPLFLLAFVLKKQGKALPFFLSGFVLFSFAGWPFYGSFFWLIKNMPYRGGTEAIYGHGRLFHFIFQTNNILGYPIAILFLVGFFASLWIWIKKDRFALNRRFYFLLLVPGSFLLYLAAHSYVWWKGIGNSLGLIRVIAAVTPLAAVTALSGLNWIIRPFQKFRKTVFVVLFFFFGWIVYFGSTRYKQNFHLSRPEQILAQACRYIHENKLDKHKIYYFSNFVPFKLGIDPFDNRRVQERLPRHQNISGALPDSSLIVWDAHFGPNEGNTPLYQLLNDSGLQLLRVFKPQVPFRVLGGYDYAVYIFQKGNRVLPEHRKIVLDFENKQDKKGRFYSDSHAFSGHYSLKMDSLIRFSPVISIPAATLKKAKCDTLKVTVQVYPVHPLAQTPSSLVISLQNGKKALRYYAYDFNRPPEKRTFRINRWNTVTVYYAVDTTLVGNADQLLIYLWNRGKKDIYFDDLEAVMLSGTGK